MFKLDDNLLRELGLGSLPAHEKNRMLGHIYETLEMRVGMKLAERMTNQQLDEFEAFIDRNDEAGALRWLETNFPNYKQVVADELETLKSEIKAAAPQIVAASQAQPIAPAAQQIARPATQAQPAQQPSTAPQQSDQTQPYASAPPQVQSNYPTPNNNVQPLTPNDTASPQPPAQYQQPYPPQPGV